MATRTITVRRRCGSPGRSDMTVTCLAFSGLDRDKGDEIGTVKG